MTAGPVPDADDLVYLYDTSPGGGNYKAPIVDFAAATPLIGYDLIVDEPGRTLDQWTPVAGTWIADGGGFLNQTDPAAKYFALAYKPFLFFHGATATQADVRFPASTSTLRRAMLGPAGGGTVTSTVDPWIGLQEGTTDGVVICKGTADRQVTPLIVAEDRWYTIRATQSGQIVSVAVDQTWYQCTTVNPAANTMTPANKLSIVVYGGPVHIRNIKLWRLQGPDW